MNPAIRCLFPLTLLCCLSTLVAQTPVVDENFSLNLGVENLSASNLLQKEAELENSIQGMNTGGGAWDFQLGEQLLELAEVKTALGNEIEASQLYNQLLLNLRVNLGLYSVGQIPIILKLVERNLDQAEYKVADELGDWVEFLFERAYSNEDDLDSLLAGYNELIAVRLKATRNHECFELDFRVEGYDHVEFSCQSVRRDRAEHFISAFRLQRKRVELLDQHPQESEFIRLQQRAVLAKISIVTAGIISGTDDMKGLYGEPLMVRRRYDPEYYYNTSFRLIRQLEKDYPLLKLGTSD